MFQNNYSTLLHFPRLEKDGIQLPSNIIGKCPHCESNFDAHQAIVAFPVINRGKKVSLVFALCPDCFSKFEKADIQQKIEIAKTSGINVFDGISDEWTVTSSLAFDAHMGDFFNAWWNGFDLARPLFDEINDGSLQDFAFSPSHVGGAL